MSWYPDPQAQAAARAQFSREQGPCPECGASAEVDAIWVPMHPNDQQFVPGLARCSARCDEDRGES